MQRILLIIILCMGEVVSAQQNDTIFLGPLHLDSVEVFPYPTPAAFKQAFLAMPIPEEQFDLYLEYSQPKANELEEQLAHLLPIKEIYPGVHVLILPFYIGVGIDINTFYENSIAKMKDKNRKKKKAKILPKFQ